MVLTKTKTGKPYRSPSFLRFCHGAMKPAPCCLCRERPWVALHHFGDDGGGAMKPSDNEVARLCTECHIANDLKRRALVRSRGPDVLEAFQNDALKLNRAYLEWLEGEKRKALPASRCHACRSCGLDGGCQARLEHVEPEADCALEELNLWLATEAAGLGPDEQRDWLLAWSNRRSANVIGFLAEPMREIAATATGSVAFVARRALRTACLEGVEDDGEDQDRLVR